MADNSKREQIILADIALVEMVTGIKTVKRTIPTLAVLDNFAVTQMPVAAVVGRLPVPKNHFAKRDGQVDFIVSNLKVDVYVFFQENESMDSELSSLLDDMWVAAYTDPKRGGLTMNTWLECNELPEWLSPYYAFQITINHQYQHLPGGI